jgi:hypothetical protein
MWDEQRVTALSELLRGEDFTPSEARRIAADFVVRKGAVSTDAMIASLRLDAERRRRGLN